MEEGVRKGEKKGKEGKGGLGEKESEENEESEERRKNPAARTEKQKKNKKNKRNRRQHKAKQKPFFFSWRKGTQRNQNSTKGASNTYHMKTGGKKTKKT